MENFKIDEVEDYINAVERSLGTRISKKQRLGAMGDLYNPEY